MPSLVSEEVQEAKATVCQLVEQVIAKRSAGGKASSAHVLLSGQDSDASFNAAEYLFVSHRLAQRFPELAENGIVLEYRSTLPGKCGSGWQHFVRNDGKPKVSTRAQAFGVSSLLSSLGLPFKVVKQALVKLVLLSAIVLPLEIQSLIIRVLEPAVFSGILFSFVALVRLPVYLALVCFAVFALLTSLIVEHWQAAKRTKGAKEEGELGPSYHSGQQQRHHQLRSAVPSGEQKVDEIPTDNGREQLSDSSLSGDGDYDYHSSSDLLSVLLRPDSEDSVVMSDSFDSVSEDSMDWAAAGRGSGAILDTKKSSESSSASSSFSPSLLTRSAPDIEDGFDDAAYYSLESSSSSSSSSSSNSSDEGDDGGSLESDVEWV